MGGGQCVLSCGNPYYCIICTTCINCIINIYRRRHARPDAAFYRLTRGRYMGRDGVENALTHLTAWRVSAALMLSARPMRSWRFQAE